MRNLLPLLTLLTLPVSGVINPPDIIALGSAGEASVLVIDSAAIAAEAGQAIDENFAGTVNYSFTIEYTSLGNTAGENAYAGFQLYNQGNESLGIGDNWPSTNWGGFRGDPGDFDFEDASGNKFPLVTGVPEQIDVSIKFLPGAGEKDQVTISFRGNDLVFLKEMNFDEIRARIGVSNHVMNVTNISFSATPLPPGAVQAVDRFNIRPVNSVQETIDIFDNRSAPYILGHAIDDTFEGVVDLQFTVNVDSYDPIEPSFARMTFYNVNEQGNDDELIGIGNPIVNDTWGAYRTLGKPIDQPFLDPSDNTGNIATGGSETFNVKINFFARSPDRMFVTFRGRQQEIEISDLSFNRIRWRQGERSDTTPQDDTQVDLVDVLITVTGENLPEPPLDRQQLPEPVFSSNPALVDFYWVAWEQAWDRVVRHPTLPVSPYIDEAFADDTNWIWDTCFMTLFCKYGPDLFPGVESLENFYIGMHDPGDPPVRIQHPDNPPLFAWAEYDNFRFTGDTTRIQNLLTGNNYLTTHFSWFDSIVAGPYPGKTNIGDIFGAAQPDGWTWNGIASGMDNTPRDEPSIAGMLWVDAIAQQGLSALYISRLATEIGEDALATQYMNLYESLKTKVNSLYWDSVDGFYYDLLPDGSGGYMFRKEKTPASFWPLLAEMASPAQITAMAASISDPAIFGGSMPLPTVARNDSDFEPTGKYWRGSIWLPTAYMSIKALEKADQQVLADTTAQNLLTHMHNTFTSYTPNTIWECYSPTVAEPAVRDDGTTRVEADFSGWSALGPISLFIENVLGFNFVDASSSTVKWRLYQTGEHGIKRLKFGTTSTDIMTDGNGWITVTTNEPYTLEINGIAHSVVAGTQTFQAVPSASYADFMNASAVPVAAQDVTGDFDSDGVANLIEYLYGSHPARNDSRPPELSQFEELQTVAQINAAYPGVTLPSGSEFYVFDVRIPADTRGLTVEVVSTSDLAGFDSSMLVALGSAVAEGPYMVQRYYVNQAIETLPMAFFRLEVTEAPPVD